MVAPLETKTLFYDGNAGTSNEANTPWIDTTYTYDDLSASQGYSYSSTAYHNLLQEVITGSNLPSSVYPLTKTWTYSPNNGTDSNGVFHYDVNKVTHSEIDDASGHVWQCQDTTYDDGVSSGTTTPSAGWPTTTTAYSTCGNSATAIKSYTAYDQYGNVVGTVDPLGVANPSLYSSHGCSVSTVAYVSASWTAGRYTSCTAYNTGHTAALPTTSTNALGQTTTINYSYTSTDQVSSTVDLNGQPTSYSYSYDSTGNKTILASEPGETTGSYTKKQTENTTCTSSSTLPCYEIDANTSLYSSAISRTFYDSQGRAIETRTPGPTPGDDTVVGTIYNDQNNSVWTSVPFQVADGSGWVDPKTTKDISGNLPAGSTVFYDALGRTLATQDPNYGSSQEPGQACSLLLNGKYTSCSNTGIGTAVGDSANYVMQMNIDPNGHVTQSFSDAAGNVRYTQTNNGVNGGTLTLGEQVQTQYNALGKPISVTQLDGRPQSNESTTTATTTMTYDDTGRLLTVVDPDQGTSAYMYDPNGNVSSVVQTSGSSSRTLGYNYDLLNSVGCEQTAAPTLNATGACSAGSPLLVNTYDTTELGTTGTTDFPIGRLTQSIVTTYYPDSTSATVTDQFQYDQRGRVASSQTLFALPANWNVTAGLPADDVTLLYNDANQVTTTSAAAGTASYSFTQLYDVTNGRLQGISSGMSSMANLAKIAYNEYARVASITYLNGSSTQIASTQYSYDGDLRPTSLTTNWLPGSGNSGEILGQTRTYDNASNVTSLNTFFANVPGSSGSGGTEGQNFCYDEQNRLVWAGNGGTQPSAGTGTCGSGTLSSGLTGAGYTAPYVYTNLGQIWQGPLNGTGGSEQYLYCDSSHPHQLTGIYPTGTTCSALSGAVYSASYDAWGNETGRIYNGTTATLSYDVLNRLTEYNAGTAGQEFYLYDAAGNRVLKRSISGGSTTLTAYAYGLQELDYTSAGAFSSQTDYYSLGGHLIGSTNGTTTIYDLTDAEGSVLTSLSASSVLGEQIYGPYGNQRYIQGTMGTDKGYTGQFHDGVSGLDYYNVRYYDPIANVFLSPDNVQGNQQGVDPYIYVFDNPETYTDPSGQEANGKPSDRKITLKQLIILEGVLILGLMEALASGDAAAAARYVQALKGVQTIISSQTPADTAPDGDMWGGGDIQNPPGTGDGRTDPNAPDSTNGGKTPTEGPPDGEKWSSSPKNIGKKQPNKLINQKGIQNNRWSSIASDLIGSTVYTVSGLEEGVMTAILAAVAIMALMAMLANIVAALERGARPAHETGSGAAMNFQEINDSPPEFG